MGVPPTRYRERLGTGLRR